MHAALAANQVLAEMYRTGRVTLPDGSSAPTLEHGLPQEEGEELYDLVLSVSPRHHAGSRYGTRQIHVVDLPGARG